ncbi:MAG TPA: hypothetical protein ENL46_01205 [Candidatus Aminicenantes bacterium]|nr:hypothetical protein [Candidatus Aminicenantes bacterium]
MTSVVKNKHGNLIGSSLMPLEKMRFTAMFSASSRSSVFDLSIIKRPRVGVRSFPLALLRDKNA